MSQAQKLAYSRVGIVHGLYGSGATHWQSWLARKCKALGAETHFPKLPDRFGAPELSPWIEALRRHINLIGYPGDQETALVCHSLGCTTGLQLLGSYSPFNPKYKLGLLVLVAPSTPSRIQASNLPERVKEAILGFYDRFDDAVAAAVKKVNKIEVFTSDNDVWVDSNAASRLAHSLGANFHLIPGGGHLSVAAGYHTFSEILALLTNAA